MTGEGDVEVMAPREVIANAAHQEWSDNPISAEFGCVQCPPMADAILAALSAAGYRVVAVDGGRDDAREGESPRLVHQPDCWVWGGADEYHEGVPFGGWTRTGDGYHGNQLRDEDRPLYRLAPAALEPDAELEAAPAGTVAALGAERERADLAERVVGLVVHGGRQVMWHDGESWIKNAHDEGWTLLADVDPAAAGLLARLAGDQP